VILGSPLCYKEPRPAKASPHFLMYFNREYPLHPLVLKKFLRCYCHMAGDMRLGLGPLRFMLGLKQMSLDIQTRSDIERLAKLIPNFRCLEVIKLRYVDPNYTISSPGGRSSSQSKAHWLFSRTYKLPRLKDFGLETSHRTIESYFSEVQGDLHAISKQRQNLKMHVKMYFAWDFLGNKKSQALGYFLRNAEALNIDCGGDAGMNILPCKNKEFCSEKRQEKQEKHNQRNTVEILSNFGCKEVNVKEVLSYCESLKTLQVKSSRDEISWRSHSDLSRETVRLEKLQNVVLDISISKLDSKTYSPEEKRQRSDEMKSNNPLLNMLGFFRENCQTLQDISLFLCVAKIDSQARLCDFLNEIKANQKIKKFELCTGDKFNLLSPEILPLNKDLESFGLHACSPSEGDKENIPDSIEWDKTFSKNEEISIKEVQMSAPISLKLTPMNFLKKFPSLQILEIFNMNSQFMTLGFISSLLKEFIEKKDMKKLVICATEIDRKNDYLKKNEWTSEMINQQKKIESLLASLKNLNMEEILIGNLQNFPADFIFYNKEFKMEKVFWSEEQLLMAFRSERKLQKLYNHFLKMVHSVFDNKDPSKKYSI